MRRIPLGRTGIEIPDLCLGTMTFGTQTSEADAHTQIGMALEHGLDFLDTAHVYPANPVSKETHGRTEEIIGNWVATSGRRGEVTIATKHIAKGVSGIAIGPETIATAVEGSLRRLQTDVIDLYQFHVPNRGTYAFRRNWGFDPSSFNGDEIRQDMADCLGALQQMVDAGKIRAFGMSNESAWGMSQWLRLAEAGAGPRVASIQNEYSLLCRMFEPDLAEMSAAEGVVLLAYSPLGAGYITGKYADAAVPQGSRKSIVSDVGGRETPRVHQAVAAYLGIAAKHGLDPVHMALAFCRQRPFPVSAIFGATTIAQLTHILAGSEVTLLPEVMAEIDAAHRACPLPF